MAHSSIYGLNPILQAEILQWIDWKGARLNAFTENPSREHSEFVGSELVKALLHEVNKTAALVQFVNNVALPSSYINQTVVQDTLKIISENYPDIYEDMLWFKENIIPHTRIQNIRPKPTLLMSPSIIRWLAKETPVCLYSNRNNQNIRYQKADNRVLRFLESLGDPDFETIKQFFTDITKDDKPTSVMSCYEIHMMCDEMNDGMTQRVFIDFYVGLSCSVVFVRKSDLEDAGYYIIANGISIDNGKLSADQSMFRNPNGDQYEKYFKLMVNAWLAERTKLVNQVAEPLASKNQVINIIGAKGDHKAYEKSAKYRYIQVTDEAWKKYKESEAVFKQHSGDCNYTKAFWFRKSHFAQRNGNIYLVSAHWCHRTCTEVSPGPEKPVVEVLV